MSDSPCGQQASPHAGDQKIGTAPGRVTVEMNAIYKPHQAAVSASPRHFRMVARRPVSGLTSLDVSPSQAVAQWLIDTPSLAYRCGGSTGIMSLRHSPVSRLTAAGIQKTCSGTFHVFPLILQAEPRIISQTDFVTQPESIVRDNSHLKPTLSP